MYYFRILPNKKLKKIKKKHKQAFRFDGQNRNAIAIKNLPPCPIKGSKTIRYMFDKDDNVAVDIVATKNIIKTERFKKLEKIFKEKWLGIQAIAIEKPWMSDKSCIQAQIDSYDKLNQFALKILEQNPDDETALAIVEKHDSALNATAMGNMMLQKFRGILEVKIENDDENIEKFLDIAQNIKLTGEELTQEKMEELLGLFTGGDDGDK
jgi:hypothetical protein